MKEVIIYKFEFKKKKKSIKYPKINYLIINSLYEPQSINK